MHTLWLTAWWSHKPTVFPLWKEQGYWTGKMSTVTVLEQSYLWSHDFLFLGLIHWICRMGAQIHEEEWNKSWDRFPMKACHILTGLRLFSFMSYSFFAGSAMLFLFIYILTWLRWWVYDQPRPQNYSNIILWKALVLSNCGKFLMIPSLIWGEIGTEMHSLFITGYTFLSQLKVYSGKCIFYSILDVWFRKLLCVLALVLVQFVICFNIDSTQSYAYAYDCDPVKLWSSFAPEWCIMYTCRKYKHINS